MQTNHSIARILIAGGFALVSLLTVAASAAVSADPKPVAPLTHADWQAITDEANQRFFFN